MDKNSQKPLSLYPFYSKAILKICSDYILNSRYLLHMAETQSSSKLAPASKEDPSAKKEGEESKELSRIEKIAEKNNQDVNKAYLQRITFVKRGRDALDRGDASTALYNYLQYFKIIANFFNTSPEEIAPELFDKENDVSECLMLSQVYWDLLHLFDRSEATKDEFNKYLAQFVKFSVGYKYQVVNSEILRKYIKKNPSHFYLKDYQKAYEQMYVVSKKCYVASYCYGEDHLVTENLRVLKSEILKFRLGHSFVAFYYRFSPRLVEFSLQNPTFGQLVKTFCRPSLFLVSWISKKTIKHS